MKFMPSTFKLLFKKFPRFCLALQNLLPLKWLPLNPSALPLTCGQLVSSAMFCKFFQNYLYQFKFYFGKLQLAHSTSKLRTVRLTLIFKIFKCLFKYLKKIELEFCFDGSMTLLTHSESNVNNYYYNNFQTMH